MFTQLKQHRPHPHQGALPLNLLDGGKSRFGGQVRAALLGISTGLGPLPHTGGGQTLFSLVAGYPACVCVVGAGGKLASWKGHTQTGAQVSEFPIPLAALG